MNGPRLLLIQPGTTAPAVRARFGDFDAWFMRALDGEPIEWRTVRVDLGEPAPDARAFDGVIVTGSESAVYGGEPWIAPSARWLRDTVEAGVPTLGVCFGHQLLGHAFGARVVRNPKGLEFGTASVTLTREGRLDPLFDGFAAELRFQQTHGDVVVEPPANVRVLATNAHCEVQAIAVGPTARGVQFHPEMTPEHIRGLGAGDGAAEVPAAEPTPAGPLLLRQFLRRFVGR